MKRTNAQISSFNAGYHRGLHTENHGLDLEGLFTRWVLDGRRTPSHIDYAEFKRGFEEGQKDYTSGAMGKAWNSRDSR